MLDIGTGVVECDKEILSQRETNALNFKEFGEGQTTIGLGQVRKQVSESVSQRSASQPLADG